MRSITIDQTIYIHFSKLNYLIYNDSAVTSAVSFMQLFIVSHYLFASWPFFIIIPNPT